MLDGGVPGGEPLSTTDPTRDIKMEKWITHRSWRKSVARLKGPHGEVSAGRERQDLECMPLLESVGFPG